MTIGVIVGIDIVCIIILAMIVGWAIGFIHGCTVAEKVSK